MANIPDEIQIKNNPTKAGVDSKRVRGGFSTVATANERYNLDDDVRRLGMEVYDEETTKKWKLLTNGPWNYDATDWVEVGGLLDGHFVVDDTPISPDPSSIGVVLLNDVDSDWTIGLGGVFRFGSAAKIYANYSCIWGGRSNTIHTSSGDAAIVGSNNCVVGVLNGAHAAAGFYSGVYSSTFVTNNGLYSVAIGLYSTTIPATTSYLFATGYQHTIGTYASYSAVFGRENTVSNVNSFACGFGAIASGDTSFACGYFTTASGTASHSEGFQTNATNEAAHAEGYYTSASQHAHSEGERTQATGTASHAEGQWTLCSNLADAGHASGYGSLARDFGQKAHSSFQFGTLTSGPPLPGSAQSSDHTLGGVSTSASPSALGRAGGSGAVTTVAGFMYLVEVSATAVARDDTTMRGYFKRRYGLFQPTSGNMVMDYDEEIVFQLFGGADGWLIDLLTGTPTSFSVRFTGDGTNTVHVVAHVKVVEMTIVAQA